MQDSRIETRTVVFELIVGLTQSRRAAIGQLNCGEPIIPADGPHDGKGERDRTSRIIDVNQDFPGGGHSPPGYSVLSPGRGRRKGRSRTSAEAVQDTGERERSKRVSGDSPQRQKP